MNDIAVKLENVSKFYKLYESPKDRLKEALHPFGKKLHRKFYALNNINLEIKKGEILGIVGRNGSGKSTLLKIISGVIQQSSGHATVNGPVTALLELGSGLHPEFTGMQNIFFGGTMMGFSKEEMEEKVDDIVNFADIGDFIHQPLKTYSNGMKARLGFALAINMEPDVLVLDEVLAVGDELFRRKCFAKMEEFFKSGCTVLFVSHSAGSVNEICSRAIFLDKGDLILEGPPKFVTLHYQKYLFAKPVNTAEIREEIIRLNQDEEKKKKFAKGIEKNGEKPAAKEKKTTPKQEAFYIPELKPKSTVVIKNFDIDIYDAYITTLAGEKVNLLETKQEYILIYKAKFHSDCNNVSFGVQFKTHKSFILLSSRLNSVGGNVKTIRVNDEFQVKYKFRCNLLKGTYFIDIGVASFENEKRTLLIHISDALIFKVQVFDKNYRIAGTTYLDQKTEIIKISGIGEKQ